MLRTMIQLKFLRNPWYAAIFIVVILIVTYQACKPVEQQASNSTQKTLTAPPQEAGSHILLDFGEQYLYQIPQNDVTNALLNTEAVGMKLWVRSKFQQQRYGNGYHIIYAMKDDNVTYLSLEESASRLNSGRPLYIGVAAAAIIFCIYCCWDGKRNGEW